MKKGISIWSFAADVQNDLEQVFTLAADAGYEGVELALAETGPVNPQSTKEDMEKIRSLAAKHGIELYSLASGLYWDYNYTSSDPKMREKAIETTKKQLELASYLGAQTILVVPGAVGVDFMPYDDITPYDVAYDRCREALAKLVPVAEQYKVELAIENVANKFLLSPLEVRDLIDSFHSPYLQAYFDVGNALPNGYPEQWIRILGQRIRKVHFKDYSRSMANYVDLLEGDVDYIAVMQAFKDIGYEGWATAEMIPPYKLYPETILYTTSIAMDKILGR